MWVALVLAAILSFGLGVFLNPLVAALIALVATIPIALAVDVMQRRQGRT